MDYKPCKYKRKGIKMGKSLHFVGGVICLAIGYKMLPAMSGEATRIAAISFLSGVTSMFIGGLAVFEALKSLSGK
jgi:hypothetical protein